MIALESTIFTSSPIFFLSQLTRPVQLTRFRHANLQSVFVGYRRRLFRRPPALPLRLSQPEKPPFQKQSGENGSVAARNKDTKITRLALNKLAALLLPEAVKLYHRPFSIRDRIHKARVSMQTPTCHVRAF